MEYALTSLGAILGMGAMFYIVILLRGNRDTAKRLMVSREKVGELEKWKKRVLQSAHRDAVDLLEQAISHTRSSCATDYNISLYHIAEQLKIVMPLVAPDLASWWRFKPGDDNHHAFDGRYNWVLGQINKAKNTREDFNEAHARIAATLLWVLHAETLAADERATPSQTFCNDVLRHSTGARWIIKHHDHSMFPIPVGDYAAESLVVALNSERTF